MNGNLGNKKGERKGYKGEENFEVSMYIMTRKEKYTLENFLDKGKAEIKKQRVTL